MKKDRKSARARALRAAQVMSLAAGLSAGAIACSASHQGEGPDGGLMADAEADSQVDAEVDSAVDAEVDSEVDAGPCTVTWDEARLCESTPTPACCETDFGGFWDAATGCCSIITVVEGPLMPPSAPV